MPTPTKKELNKRKLDNAPERSLENTTIKGCLISFHNIGYWITPKSDGGCKNVQKPILQNIDGLFRPGLNAIMGPSGSGKTTLLDVIAGRKDPIGVNGHILVDGNPQPKNYKCMTGYVVQDDVVMGTLTVRENLMFSANVRLKKETTLKQKKEKVDDILSELGLEECADTKVGNEFIRGVSGGERKRTNIGMELIISPSTLFLDEPTTGLDASTSYAVLIVLHRLAKRGRTIVFSIHQPRYVIFKLFDTLMLLSRGLTVYHGPAKECLNHFKSIGYECEEHDNPSDFFLDVVNGDSSAVRDIKEGKKKLLSISPERKTSLNAAASVSADVLSLNFGLSTAELREYTLAQELSEDYSKSQYHQQIMDESLPILNNYMNRLQHYEKVERAIGHYATGFITQFRYVTHRAFLNMVRNPMASVLQSVVMLIVGVIIGVLYLDMDDTVIPGIQNRSGLIFFVVMNNAFSNLAAVEVFIKERAIFVHENSSGFYRVSAYFFAKVLCDLIAMRILPLILYTIIVYFSTGLRVGLYHFGIFYLALFLVSICGATLGFFLSCSLNMFTVANMLLSFIYVSMMIFGGLFVNLDSIPIGIQWIQYVSMFRYAVNILSINEFKGLEFFAVLPNGTKISAGLGEHLYLDNQGIVYGTLWDFYKNALALCCITCILLLLAYVQLRRLKKYK